MNNIPPYLMEKSKYNPFSFYMYLHIRGGSGDPQDIRERKGGQYDYLLYYALPEQMEGCNICERIWCEEKGITYGVGNTIDEAYKNYLSAL